jgi:hypothetical protein
MDDVLKELADRMAITDLIHRYASGIDMRDWALYRSIFADEVFMDFSSYSGAPGTKMGADDWVAGCQRMLPGFDATQHSLTNFVYDIRDDEATVTVYMQAEHFIANTLGDASHTLGGYYLHRLRRGGDGWRIHATTLTVLWSRGNRHVYQLAAERVAARGK